AILSRAQTGTEQLLAAAGLGDDQIKHVAEEIVKAAIESTEAGRTPAAPPSPAAAIAAAPPVSPPSAMPKASEPPTDEPAREPAGAKEAPSSGKTPADESRNDQQP